MSAYVKLAKCYMRSIGVAVNLARAFTLFKHAAEHGNTDAQTHIGLMFCKGQYVQKDYAWACAAFERAARQSNPQRCYCLSLSYRERHGTDKNVQLEIDWCKLAAKAGIQEVVSRIHEIFNEQYINQSQDKRFALLDCFPIISESNALKEYPSKVFQYWKTHIRPVLGNLDLEIEDSAYEKQQERDSPDFLYELPKLRVPASEGDVEAQYKLTQSYDGSDALRANQRRRGFCFRTAAENGQNFAPIEQTRKAVINNETAFSTERQMTNVLEVPEFAGNDSGGRCCARTTLSIRLNSFTAHTLLLYPNNSLLIPTSSCSSPKSVFLASHTSGCMSTPNITV